MTSVPDRCVAVRTYHSKAMDFQSFLLCFFFLLLSSSLLSPICRVFTVLYLKQAMLLGYTVLQLFCNYNLCYM